ncbi:DUF3866 family protein [Brevibacterium litoralis]|uniref:DUF3866 family protein n=1 Tax=Brevibacterium litoralis TaxID=3138935 RepID=UPI0032EEBCB4
MIHWREATVESVKGEWPGVREVWARPSTPLPGTAGEQSSEAIAPIRAIAYADLVGTPEEGDRVLLNVSALARGLGTGGFALVVALPDRLPADPPPADGHLVKDRYSPTQTMVLGVDDQESPHHHVLAEARSIDGMPVVVADLHSALPAVIAGLRTAAPEARVSYVMTDGAALALPFSRAVAGLVEAGWLHSTFSVGQAWGGDHEAVTVHSALLAARHVVEADVVVVAQGPGNLGTGTPFGFSGMVVGDHLNAVAALGGEPVACLRMSDADARGRHYGISHHTLTAVGTGALTPVHLPVPDFRDMPQKERLKCDRDPAMISDLADEQVTEHLARHRRVDVSTVGLFEALTSSPVRLSTMGRGLTEDTPAFLAAAAAGPHAATLLG